MVGCAPYASAKHALALFLFVSLFFSKNVLTKEEARSIINPVLRNAPLAQLVEHLTLNQGVPGSSP